MQITSGYLPKLETPFHPMSIVIPVACVIGLMYATYLYKFVGRVRVKPFNKLVSCIDVFCLSYIHLPSSSLFFLTYYQHCTKLIHNSIHRDKLTEQQRVHSTIDLSKEAEAEAEKAMKKRKKMKKRPNQHQQEIQLTLNQQQ